MAAKYFPFLGLYLGTPDTCWFDMSGIKKAFPHLGAKYVLWLGQKGLKVGGGRPNRQPSAAPLAGAWSGTSDGRTWRQQSAYGRPGATPGISRNQPAHFLRELDEAQGHSALPGRSHPGQGRASGVMLQGLVGGRVGNAESEGRTGAPRNAEI
jgi:hypothetical protein